MASTGYIFTEEGLLHDTGYGHPERPERLRAIRAAFAEAGLDPPRLPVAPAMADDLLRVHTKQHVNTIHGTCALGTTYPDPETPMVKASWPAALVAAGGAISACKAVLEGTVDNAFCAVRPPGHHAEADRAMGFCLFNNVAIAARWLREEAGLSRVAIFDWDVHHGNGTQHAFYEDDSVYYVSIHQHPHFPGTGYPHERGKNNTILNIQMPRGVPAETWHNAIETQVLPELEAFAPEFLLISSGFDAHLHDPLGGQRLEAEDFALMTQSVAHLADGRIVSVLEGGYDLQGLAESVVAHFQALQRQPARVA